MKIVVIDNYDSFTYNLVQLLGEFTPDIKVIRNDMATVEDISSMNPDRILISPGPGKPDEAGISMETVRHLGARAPVLGVCLGHQAIGQLYGAKVVHAPAVKHGKSSEILHDGRTIFKNLPEKFTAGRYHSLIVDRNTLPDELEITALSENLIMGIRHKRHPVEGIQFHPESVLTNEGYKLIKNWVEQ